MLGPLGGFLGLNGGANGTGFSGPQDAPIVNPTNPGQISDAYANTQNSMQSQQALLSALQAQNGLANQNQIYGQLQGIANGTGPNPAQAMLNQSTGQNVANQAALMAGQRGASSNVGLIARQAAQQGAATQQQAIGQGATLQANQSLAAINQAGNVANTQATNQIGQTNANTQAQQAEQQALINAQLGTNTANVGSQTSVNAGNTGLANTTLQGQQGIFGGVLQGVGAGLAGLAAGGDVSDAAVSASAFGAQSKFGQFLNNVSQGQQTSIDQMQPKTGSDALQKGSAQTTSGLMKLLGGGSGGSGGALAGGVDAADLSGAATMMAASGGMTHDYRGGGKVNAKSQNEKAMAPGNSYANDKIPAVLSEHEIVIPRSVTMGKDPVNDSARFVAAVMAKRRGKA